MVRLGDVVERLSAGLLGFAAVFTLLPWTPLLPGWSALLVPWRLHAAVASLLAVAVLVGLRRRRAAAVWLVVAAASGLWVPPRGLPLGGSARPRPDAPVAGFRLMSWNVLADHAEHDQVVDQLRTARPDVVALTEVTPGLVARLEREGIWPYRHFEPAHYEGLGVLSRHPIVRVDVARPGPTLQFPLLRVQLDVRGVPVEVVVVHTATPMNEVGIADRNATVVWLAEQARQSPVPLVIAGDLNLPPWTSEFHALVRDGGLTDAVAWRQVGPTWPCWLDPVGLPLDHVLTTPLAHVRAITRSPCGPSDHHGLVALVELWRPDPPR